MVVVGAVRGEEWVAAGEVVLVVDGVVAVAAGNTTRTSEF